MEAALHDMHPILLLGETGVGKTTIVRELAKEKGKEMVRLSLSGNISREELVGKYELIDGNTVWRDGALITAMRNGTWVVLDEVNAAAPEVMFALHGVLDDERAVVLQEKDGERVVAHENFRVFATMNPDTYSGTKIINQAFYSRFIVFTINHLPPELEVDMLMEQTGVDKTVASEIVSVADKLRALKKEDRIEFFCSTRDILMAARLTKRGLDVNKAVQFAVTSKMSPTDIEETLDGSPDMASVIITFTKDAKNLVKEEADMRALIEKTRERLKEGQTKLKEHQKVEKELENKNKELSTRNEVLVKENTALEEKRLKAVKHLFVEALTHIKVTS